MQTHNHWLDRAWIFRLLLVVLTAFALVVWLSGCAALEGLSSPPPSEGGPDLVDTSLGLLEVLGAALLPAAGVGVAAFRRARKVQRDIEAAPSRAQDQVDELRREFEDIKRGALGP